jgi:mono/diheme cytochrome c family protein
MTLRKFAAKLARWSCAFFTFSAAVPAQSIHVNPARPGSPSIESETSHVDGITGHAVNGKSLYEQFCIGCHGADGNGKGPDALHSSPKPRDFSRATFKCRSTPTGDLPTDEDLFNAITRGVVGTTMKPWTSLSAQQRADLVAFIKTWSPRWATEKPGTPLVIPPETPDKPESVERGKVLFQTTLNCSKCHGTEGLGDGRSAATLQDDDGNPIKPRDFVHASRFKCGTTNEDLYRILMTGLDGTPMSSFSDSLDASQAWDLIHYLRTLQQNYRPPHTQKAAAKPSEQQGR